jgi:hypothetical protein
VPLLNLPIDPAGPILTAVVMPSAQRLQALQKATQPIPPPQTGRFLVDTGASGTLVDPAFIAPLGLTPKNYRPIATPTTNPTQPPQLRPVYDVQIILMPSLSPRTVQQLGPPGMMPHLRALSVIASGMRHQGLDGLIGRDVLDHVLFVYNGHAGTYTLSW